MVESIATPFALRSALLINAGGSLNELRPPGKTRFSHLDGSNGCGTTAAGSLPGAISSGVNLLFNGHIVRPKFSLEYHRNLWWLNGVFMGFNGI